MTHYSPDSVFDYADGELIVRQGDADERMFIILTGMAEASREINGERIVLQRFSAGDFFGEMSLLEGLPRSADIHAVGPTRVTILGGGGLLQRIRRDPAFALGLLKSLSGRLRQTTEKYEQEVLQRQDLHASLERNAKDK